MRAGFQVLVIPFTLSPKVRYAVFKRAEGYWQFIAGGGENGESPVDAAKREAYEEAKIEASRIVSLETNCSVPRSCFGEHKTARGFSVVQEYGFGMLLGHDTIEISGEHSEYLWLEYEAAYDRLKYDSNRTALWELHERINIDDY